MKRRLQGFTFFVSLLFLWPSIIFASPTAVTSKTFEVKGVKIHYIVQGSGEPVILIHGLGSSANINWQRPGIFDALAKRHRVVALDLPGFGDSDKPIGTDAYGHQWVGDILALMDRLNIKKAHIVGYSMGGIVALNFVSTYPDRVITGVLGGMGWMEEGSKMQQD